MTSRLLVVDDELFVRELLSEYFTKLSYQVRTAGSAHEALQIINIENPQAVLVDLRMPGADGMELVRSISESVDAPAIVLMTGYPTVDTAVEALRLGVCDYVAKPFRLKELGSVVARAIRQKEQRGEVLVLRERVVELETRIAGLRRREEGTHGSRRLKIVEKAEPVTYEYQSESTPRHRLHDAAGHESGVEESAAGRRKFEQPSMTLMDESS